MLEGDSKKLSELRVVDLRAELERRGLDRNGNKQALVERLSKALKDEGHDPETYVFDASDKKISGRLSTSSRENIEGQADKLADDVLEESGNAGLEQEEELIKSDAEQNEDGEMRGADKNETADEKKGENKNAKEGEAESPIHLTLEEGEGLNEEEPEHGEEEKGEQTEQQEQEEKPDKDKADAIKQPEKTADDKKTGNDKSMEGDATKKAAPVDATTQEEAKKDQKDGGNKNSEAKSTQKRASHQNRNLWITNISQTTRATELKQALSEHGKVIGAKVVINARFPGNCCYGYVTMDTVADADNCIAKLNNTELNGQIIRIEKVRPDHLNPFKNQTRAADAKEKAKVKPENDKKAEPKVKKEGEKKEKEKKEVKNGTQEKPVVVEGPKSVSSEKSDKRSHSKGRGREKTRRSGSKTRHDRSVSSKSKKEQRRSEVLTFDKIKEERERQRLREKERILREESRRHREEVARQREIERLQRTEAERLEREREKLRIEREKIEREKAEIIRLERERQKIEREKLELERLELQRVKQRLQEEDRRTLKRPAPYRREGSYEERKRSATDRHYDEAPPAPRFDPPPVIKTRESSPKKFTTSSKDFKSRLGFEKRETYPKRDAREFDLERSHQSSSMNRQASSSVTSKYESNSVFSMNRERDMRDPRGREGLTPIQTSRLTKDTRYTERDRSPHYRAMREERRPDKPDIRPRDRYESPKDMPSRFERGSGNSWGSSNTTSKAFQSSSSGAPKTWSKDNWRPSDSSNNSNRWNPSGGPRGTMSNSVFSGNSSMNLGPSCPPPPGLNNYPSDRFDYKSMGSMRKY